MGNEPAGSLEPIDAGKGKWTHNIDANGIVGLAGLADDINKAVDQTVKQVARGKIRVGKLLIEARALFENDIDFGKWRVEKTMIQSKQHAHYLMQVAERFGEAKVLIDGANYSVMQELVLAEQKDIQWVVDKIDSGETMPTVVEVRQKVKQTQAERLAPKGTSKKGKIIQHGTIASPNAPINMVVQMSLTHRIQEVLKRGIKDIMGDYVILGMDPDPQCPCHPEVLDWIAEMWLRSTNNLDEERAVQDSYERVTEEFKNWDRR